MTLSLSRLLALNASRFGRVHTSGRKRRAKTPSAAYMIAPMQSGYYWLRFVFKVCQSHPMALGGEELPELEGGEQGTGESGILLQGEGCARFHGTR